MSLDNTYPKITVCLRTQAGISSAFCGTSDTMQPSNGGYPYKSSLLVALLPCKICIP